MFFILPSRWNGRFGNRMYQYLYAYYYSKINNIQMMLPSEWEGSKLFKSKPYSVIPSHVSKKIIETRLTRHDLDPALDIISGAYDNVSSIVPNSQQPYEYDGGIKVFSSVCFYNAEIFKPMKKQEVKDLFEFSYEVKALESYQYWKSKSGTYDVAHLRRDDVSDPSFNNRYFQMYSTISLESYYKAFQKFGFDKNKIEFISDDYTKKWHVDRKSTINLGWSYQEGSVYSKDIMFDWLDDFLKMYFARTIFRANSSFSWWASFLSPTAKVYSPIINESKIYGKNNVLEELEVEFIEGNEPHWFYEPGTHFSDSGKREIIINE